MLANVGVGQVGEDAAHAVPESGIGRLRASAESPEGRVITSFVSFTLAPERGRLDIRRNARIIHSLNIIFPVFGPDTKNIIYTFAVLIVLLLAIFKIFTGDNCVRRDMCL